jgi:glycosyltransferase involved in cell wall biosynthesis
MKQFLKSRLRTLLGSLPAAAALGDYLIRREHPVFMFHRILPPGQPCYADEMSATPEVLDDFLGWLTTHYEVVPLAELSRVSPGRVSSRRPLCGVTFDDGWVDNYEHAFPILKKHNVPATIFLATGFVGTERRLWQDRLWRTLDVGAGKFDPAEVAARLWGRFPWCPVLSAEDITVEGLRRVLMKASSHDADEFVERLEELTGQAFAPGERGFLNWEEVREMDRAGVEFGSHTHNHTLLTAVSPAVSLEEVRRSKVDLEQVLDHEVTSFSYPWGRTVGHITRQVAESGFERAVTAEVALRNGSPNPFLISRIPVSGPVLTKGRDEFEPRTARVSFALAQIRSRRKLYQPIRGAESNTPLRIAFLIDTIESWSDGGTERQLNHLLNALDRRYFEPQLFLMDTTPVSAGEIPCPVHVIRKGSGPRPLWLLRNLTSALKQFQPHVVQTFFPDATLFGTIAARRAGVPIVIHAERNLGHERNRRDRILLPWVRRYATGFQCNSRTIESVLRADVAPDHIEILYNQLDTESFEPASRDERSRARAALGLCEQCVVFVAVSHLRRIKDLGTLVSAAALLRGKLPHFRFVVLGEGDMRRELEQHIAAAGLSDFVKLAGRQEDVRPWLAAADVGILTSRSEGSSNAVMEYMAAALPAVLSDIPANKELVDGVFYRTGDAADLADKLLSLASDPEQRAQLGQEYRHRSLQYGTAAFRERAQSYYVRLASRMKAELY